MVNSSEQSRIGKSNVNRSKNHERLVAKFLTEWSGVEFRRRRVTGRDTATRMVEATADVIPINGDFLFSIEAKCGKRFSFDSLLSGIHTCVFSDWWHQTSYDSQLGTADRGYNIYPMLFFRPSPQSNWVAFSINAIPILRSKNLNKATSNVLWFPHLIFYGYSCAGLIDGDVSHTRKPKIVKLLLDDVVFCRWKDFADNVDPISVFINL